MGNELVMNIVPVVGSVPLLFICVLIWYWCWTTVVFISHILHEFAA